MAAQTGGKHFWRYVSISRKLTLRFCSTRWRPRLLVQAGHDDARGHAFHLGLTARPCHQTNEAPSVIIRFSIASSCECPSRLMTSWVRLSSLDVRRKSCGTLFFGGGRRGPGRGIAYYRIRLGTSIEYLPEREHRRPAAAAVSAKNADAQRGLCTGSETTGGWVRASSGYVIVAIHPTLSLIHI